MLYLKHLFFCFALNMAEQYRLNTCCPRQQVQFSANYFILIYIFIFFRNFFITFSTNFIFLAVPTPKLPNTLSSASSFQHIFLLTCFCVQENSHYYQSELPAQQQLKHWTQFGVLFNLGQKILYVLLAFACHHLVNQ